MIVRQTDDLFWREPLVLFAQQAAAAIVNARAHRAERRVIKSIG